MRALILLFVLLTASPALAIGPEMLLAVMGRSTCSPAVETGDTIGYFSAWTLSSSGACAATYYWTATYVDDNDEWTIALYSDAAKTNLVSSGSSTTSTLSFTGSVQGSVHINGAPGTGDVSYAGTLAPASAKPAAGTPLRTDGHWSVTGLVGAWPLNEGSGTTVTNVVTGATGTLTNAAFVSGGVSANANGRIETNTTIPATYTIITEASFAGTLSDTVFGTNASETSATALAVITASSLYQYYFRGIVQTSSGASMTPGTSDVIALTKSGTTYALYKNGVAGTPVTRAESMTTNTLHLGNTGEVRTGQAKTFGWALMYNRALSASEIASLSSNPWQIFAGY